MAERKAPKRKMHKSHLKDDNCTYMTAAEHNTGRGERQDPVVAVSTGLSCTARDTQNDSIPFSNSPSYIWKLVLCSSLRGTDSSRERLKSGRPVEKPLAMCTRLEMITAWNYEKKERDGYHFM